MTSQAKKDAAAQAYTLGCQAFKRKDFVRAEKYLRKSIKYHPTREAQHLLSNIETLKAKEQKYQKQRNTAPRYKPPQTQRATTNVRDPEIRRILNEEDYYALFGIDQDFRDEKNLTKKYRKLAMKFHPDRNQEPGAEDAFKKIASAYECLKDPQKRQLYDQYGTDAPELRQMNHQFHHMHPEDIFRFIGLNFHHQRPGQGENEPRVEQNPLSRLMSFLPILLILGYSLFSTSTYEEPDPFSLERTPEFPIARQHSEEGIDFFVSHRFAWIASSRPNYLRQVEDLVEGRYLEKLQKACKQEKKHKQHQIQDASMSRGESMVMDLKAAYELREPSCETYEKYIISK